MSEYPFNLQGPQEKIWGPGQKDGAGEVSDEFHLQQGIVIAEIEHCGHGDIKLEFVPTEVVDRDVATVARVGGTLGSAFVAGAAVGSIIPGAGTLAGGLIGAAVGYFTGKKAGEAIDSAITPTVWTPVDYTGEFNQLFIIRVGENDEASELGALAPGKYRLEVESKDKWTCHFIQPDLGQSFGPLVDNDEGDDDELEAGTYLIGPLRSGSRPLLTNLRHDGRGFFCAIALSVDGTHECIVFAQEGQFLVEDHQTEIKPGKEYIVWIESDGRWYKRFTEGY